MAWSMRQDLAACFTWKQVRIGFPSMASRLAEVRRRVVHVVSSERWHRVQTEDGWVNAIDCIGRCYPYFIVFVVLDPRGILVF
jgi:hypothetical protein